MGRPLRREPVLCPPCIGGVRGLPLRALVLLCAVVQTACVATPAASPVATPETNAQTQRPPPIPAVVRLAVAPPVITPDGHLRFVTTPANELQAQDAATGATLWTLPVRISAAAPTARWHILVTDDSTSVYAQSTSDAPALTYQGTRRIEARTGVELANDLKYEIYWYENVVLWTAFTQGKLQMAIERPSAGGGGYWLRTLDPLTLKMLTSVPVATRPATPGP